MWITVERRVNADETSRSSPSSEYPSTSTGRSAMRSNVGTKRESLEDPLRSLRAGGLPAEVRAHLERRPGPAHRVEVQAGGAAEQQLSAQQGRVLDADPAHLVRLSGYGLQALSELERDVGSRHRGHALEL